MADITNEINDFKNAEYGEEVRDSLISLAQKVNTESSKAKADAESVVTRANTGEFVGAKGDPGEKGAKGDKGDKGDPGPKGDQGDKGIKGDQGEQGPPGKFEDLTPEQKESLRGDTGPVGPQGPVGNTGSKGDKGAVFKPFVSEDGELSWTNDGGLPNPTPVNVRGLTGHVYTPNIDANGNLSWENDGNLENPDTVNITGPRGPEGPPGPKGSDGTMSFEDLTQEQKESLKGATYIPSVSESGELSWINNGGYENPVPVNIFGKNGRDGEDGKDGAPGTNGKDGTPGKNGVTFTPLVSETGELSWTNDGGLGNPVTVNIKGKDGSPGTNGAPGKSAYSAAKEGGYEGTEQEFNSLLGDFTTNKYVDDAIKNAVTDVLGGDY